MEVTEAPTPKRDQEAVLRFIERFAAVLDEGGFPRMPARTFVALLVTDSGRLTAAELAELLHVSPAAISGAVRYLLQVNLVSREREPGSRRDQYFVRNDAWYEAAMRQEQMLSRWEDSLQQGIEALGSDTPGGARLAETLMFFEFLQKEMPALLASWRERKDELIKQRLKPR